MAKAEVHRLFGTANTALADTWQVHLEVLDGANACSVRGSLGDQGCTGFDWHTGNFLHGILHGAVMKTVWITQ